MKLKPNQPMHYPGFISPDGKLYSCPREAHSYLAAELVKKYFPKIRGDAQQILENNGWLHIGSGGQIWFIQETITQRQMDVLGDLLTCEHHEETPLLIANWRGDSHDKYTHGTPESWQKNITEAIKYYSS